MIQVLGSSFHAMPTRSRCTLSVTLGFLCGIALPPIESLFILLISVSLTALLCIIWHSRAVLILCVVTGICLGVIRVSATALEIDASHIAFYNDGEAVSFSGVITEEPDVRNDHTKITVEADTLFQGDFERVVQGRVLISTGKYPELSYGDRVEVFGRVATPSSFEDFSYKDYLARYHIYSVAYQAGVKKTASGEGSAVKSRLFSLKKNIEAYYNSILPEPHASFLSGLVLGSRRSIPQYVLDDFQTTGLTHIIAISGYNITLIIAAVGGLLRPLRRGKQTVISIVLISFFTILVGASAAVVRASIMGILGLLVLQAQRTTNALMGILLTAAIMCAYNPLMLTRDVGFQLSFSAVLGLVYVSPLLSRVMEKLPAALGIRESLALTIAAQIAATPLILFHFGRISLIAPLANMVIAPALPLAMLSGGVLLLVAWLPHSFVIVIATIAWLPLTFVLWSANILASIPLAATDQVSWGWVHTIGWYIVVATLLWRHHIRATSKEASTV